MAIEKINFSYPKGSLQSVFDTEEMTALELASKTSKKVDECVELVNGVEQSAIEATAVVDEMRVAQEQFITDNNDVRSQLVIDNQTFLDALSASNTTFQNDVNTSKTTFETNMNTSLTNFQNSVDGSKTTYENNMNADLLAFQGELDTAKTNYETAANNQLTTFQGQLNTEKQTFIDSANQLLIDKEAEIDTTVVNQVNTKIDTMNTDGTLGQTMATYIDPKLLVVENKVKSIEVNVVDYGAKFDGVTDDTQAFLDAIAAFPNGASIIMPKGTAIISAPIILPSNFTLRGKGIDQTILKLANNNNGSVVQVLQNKNVTVEDFTIDGNSDYQTSSSPLLYWKARYITTRNVKIVKSRTIAINASNVEYSTIENCVLKGTLSNTVISFSNDAVEYANGYNIIRNNFISEGYLDGIIYNNNNGIIDGNIIWGCGAIPTNTAGGIYSNNKTGLTIVNNIIYQNDGNGIDLLDCKNIIINGNLSKDNNSAGIMLSSCKHAVVSNNICRNNAVNPVANQNDGISILNYGDDIIITGNTCYDDKTQKTQNYGIDVGIDSKNVNISNNNCIGNMYESGIVVASNVLNVTMANNLPLANDRETYSKIDVTLATTASIALVATNTKICIVEIIDKSTRGYARFLLRSTNNEVVELEDTHNLFEVTDTGTNSCVIYNGTNYVLKNKAAATRYYSYKITYIS